MTEPVSEAVELRFGAVERLPKLASWLEERMHFNEAKDVRSAVAALTAFAAREDELRRERDEARSEASAWASGGLAEVGELRSKLTDEIAIVDRVWRALGISAYEEAGGKEISQLVREMKSRAELAEARIAQAVADEREACAAVADLAIQHIAREPHSPDIDAGGLRAAEHIASAIRSRALLQQHQTLFQRPYPSSDEPSLSWHDTYRERAALTPESKP